MKVPVTLLALVLAGSAFAAMPAGAAQEAAEKKDAPAAKKETQWQGNVIRFNKDQSILEIHGGPECIAQFRAVALSRALPRAAIAAGSVSPLATARSMRRALTPSRSDTNMETLIDCGSARDSGSVDTCAVSRSARGAASHRAQN